MLPDEPASLLDPERIDEALKIIHNLVEEGRTMIIVTHKIRFAREMANKTIFLYQGMVEEQAKPEQMFFEHNSGRCRNFVSTHFQRSGQG